MNATVTRLGAGEKEVFMNIFFILALVCALGAFGTLFAGVGTMGNKGVETKRKGNKLMQMRVGLQAAAIVFAFLAVASS